MSEAKAKTSSSSPCRTLMQSLGVKTFGDAWEKGGEGSRGSNGGRERERERERDVGGGMKRRGRRRSCGSEARSYIHDW